MTTQINGVNIPGQWLTPEYIIEHQIRARDQLKQPPLRVCPDCDDYYLGRKPETHFCPKRINQTTIRAAFPWQRKDTQ